MSARSRRVIERVERELGEALGEDNPARTAGDFGRGAAARRRRELEERIANQDDSAE